MARHRTVPRDHDHDYESFPTSAGLVRLICRECGGIGVGLAEEFGAAAGPLATDEARSILDAIAAGPSHAAA